MQLQLRCPKTSNQMASRRSAKYQPSTWTPHFIEPLKITHSEEIHKETLKKLEEEVREMISDQDVEPLVVMELVDNIQRLGLSYRFEKDITTALDRIVLLDELSNRKYRKSLHATALRFRLLRQYGYEVSQDVFTRFKDENGNFKVALCNDVKGMLGLYEASCLGFEGENILDEAREFTSSHLNNHMKTMDCSLGKQVSHSLELPLHRRMPRLDAKKHIEAYATRKDANHVLLELATLDFNMVQSTHQRDFQEMSRWWTEMGLATKLTFARDRLTESFFWTVGMIFEPQYSSCRKGLTKVVALITAIDDIYDVYGSFEELELFTNAVQRWSIDSIEELPNYMKLCFLALYNTVNEIGYDIMKQGGANTIWHLKKSWAELLKTWLQEAKWSRKKHKPKLEEYLENGCVSSSGVLLLVHAYCLLMNQNITEEALHWLDNNNTTHLLRHPSMIFRLCNDLASSSADLEGGETAKSIPCYIHETGVSEELAREHIRKLIDESWKQMNKAQAAANINNAASAPPYFCRPFMEVIVNLARIAHCTYQHGDAHGAPDSSARSRILSLLIEPINHNI